MSYEQSKSMAMRDMYIDGDNIFFSNHTFNALIYMNKKDGELHYEKSFPGNVTWMKGMHRKIIKYKDYLYFIPNEASGISKYDLKTKEIKFYKSDMDFLILSDAIVFGNTLYLIPRLLNQPLYLFEMDKCIFIKNESWNQRIFSELACDENSQAMRSCIIEKTIWTLMKNINVLIETHLNLECSIYRFENNFLIHDIASDGKNLLMISQEEDTVVRWNKNHGFVDKYVLTSYRKNKIRDGDCIDYRFGNIIILPQRGNEFCVINPNGKIIALEIPSIKRVDDKAREQMPLFGGFSFYGNEVYFLPWAADKLYVFSLDTYEIKLYDMTFKEIESYYKNIAKVSEIGNDGCLIKEANECYHEGKFQNIDLTDHMHILTTNLYNDANKEKYFDNSGEKIYTFIKQG